MSILGNSGNSSGFIVANLYKAPSQSIVNKLFSFSNFIFLNEVFDVKNNNPNMIPFAHNSRTICLAFAGLAARYCRKTININDFLNKLDHSEKDKFYEEYLYDLFKELNGLDSIFNYDIYKTNKDEIDKGLYNLFSKLINEGFKNYSMAKKQNSQKISNETNYLKNDKNYFDIIFNSWNDFVAVFEENSNLFVK